MVLTIKEGNLKLKTEDKSENYANFRRQVNIAVSPELLTAFKTKCASYDFTMTDVLTDCMLRFIDQPDGQPQSTERGWQDGSR